MKINCYHSLSEYTGRVEHSCITCAAWWTNTHITNEELVVHNIVEHNRLPSLSIHIAPVPNCWRKYWDVRTIQCAIYLWYMVEWAITWHYFLCHWIMWSALILLGRLSKYKDVVVLLTPNVSATTLYSAQACMWQSTCELVNNFWLVVQWMVLSLHTAG